MPLELQHSSSDLCRFWPSRLKHAALTSQPACRVRKVKTDLTASGAPTFVARPCTLDIWEKSP
jgi:hypothetical protein